MPLPGCFLSRDLDRERGLFSLDLALLCSLDLEADGERDLHPLLSREREREPLLSRGRELLSFFS